MIGTNGAGKSTLINLLSGELRPTRGTIAAAAARTSRAGRSRTARAPASAAATSTPRSSRRFTVFENCRLAAQARHQHCVALVERRGALRRLERALPSARSRSVGLGARAAHRIAGTLSHGEQRQLEIAMCLATRAAGAAARRAARRHGRRGSRAHAWRCCSAEAPATRSCWSSTTWTRCSRSPTASR